MRLVEITKLADDQVRKRQSTTKAFRDEQFEYTNAVANSSIESERIAREKKTARLRAQREKVLSQGKAKDS